MSLEFHPEAEHELTEAALHYDREVEGLGDRFLSEIRRATTLLGKNPRMGHRVEGQLRRVILRRFPFSLIYAHHADNIFILAVAHQRRRPGYWRTRLVR